MEITKKKDVTTKLIKGVLWTESIRQLKIGEFFRANLLLRPDMSSSITRVKKEYKDNGIDAEIKTKRISDKEFTVTRIK